MDEAKQKALVGDGWKVGTVQDLLGLTNLEVINIELECQNAKMAETLRFIQRWLETTDPTTDTATLDYVLHCVRGALQFGQELPDAISIVETNPEAALALLKRQAERQASDPRTTCPGCGKPALDGKITCGDVRCGSSTGQ